MKNAKRILFAAVSLVALLALSQVVLFNLRLHRTLLLQSLSAECSSLEREIEELRNESAVLLSPSRLSDLGAAMGLGPVPLDMMALEGAAPPVPEDAVAQLR